MECPNQNSGLIDRFLRWCARHPYGAIAWVSFLAVVINCYPVIFCGRSFVSPGTYRWALLYDWWPSLPGMVHTDPIDREGSDTASILYWGVPAGFIESRSLLDHGEFPLWDRYGHAGSTFIGQAVSMLGDPLQWIVILGRGSALAWDIKFLAARFLFCAGFGVLILRLLESQGLSLLFSVLAAYCGANFYTRNHPVVFVYAYAPWILLSALRFLDSPAPRYVGWGLVWLLVNFACFNAGHVEVAVVLIGGLNLAALIQALWQQMEARDRIRVLARLGTGTLLFLGLTAPVWVSFLVALGGAYSTHKDIRITQLPLVILPGVFDDVFNLLLRKDANIFSAPGCGLIFLPAGIYAVLKWRRLKAEPFFWINSAAIVVLISFIFAFFTVPLLRMIPLLNRVGHNCTDFSYLLIIHLMIQAGYGFKCLARETDFRRATRQFFWLGVILEGSMLLYCLVFQLAPGFWHYVLCVTAAAAAAPWLFAFLKSRGQPISLAGWLGIFILGFSSLFRYGLYHAGNDQWLVIPAARATFDFPSPAIQTLPARAADPFRVAGLRMILWGDYAAVYGLEDIRSCAPLSNGPYMELLGTFPGISFVQDGWEMQIADPVRAQPLLNLLNVRYLLAPPKVNASDEIDLRVIDRSDLGVVENPEAWPRAFFDSQWMPVTSNEQLVHRLVTGSRQPFIALDPAEIRGEPGLSPLEGTNNTPVVPATHYQLGVNATAFDIHAPSAGVVCLTEGQAKDFTVRISDQTGDRVGRVLTVNRAFKGVYLDRAGDYHIMFTYRPRYWMAACLAFCLSLFLTGLMVVLLLVLGSRTKPRPNAHG